MTKKLSVTRSDIDDHRAGLLSSAEQTRFQIAKLVETESPLQFLSQLKFQAIGCDPLNPSRPLNLIEQLNQTFTYLASFDGAKFLFSRHLKVRRFTLNLGTAAGSDIETPEEDGIAAEVFAAVTPQNNRKLAADVKKVLATKARHRYVLFISPGHEVGPYRLASSPSGVVVWSLGHTL